MNLYFAPIGGLSGISTREEAFMSRLAQKIPGVAGSQRGYTTYLNVLRRDIADPFINGLKPQERANTGLLEGFGHWINVASGRGDIPKSLGTAGALSNAFFAPRYAMSRIEVPAALTAALARSPAAQAAFAALDAANRYAMLWRLHTAKKPETRERQIAKFVEMLARGEKIHE